MSPQLLLMLRTVLRLAHVVKSAMWMRKLVSAAVAARLATEGALPRRDLMECCALEGLSILSDLERSDRWTLV